MNEPLLEIWSHEYRLPLVPQHHNPWLYMAYAKSVGVSISPVDLETYYRACTVIPGVFKRRPDGQGGKLSHDEMIGAAYLSSKIARDLYLYLDVNSGYYDSEKPGTRKPATYMWRFPWLKPYLRTIAGQTASLLDQIFFCAYVLRDAIDSDAGVSSRLRIRLMAEHMMQYRICRCTLSYWRKKILKRWPGGAKELFNIYFPNYEIFENSMKDGEL